MEFERSAQIPHGSVLTSDVCVIGSGAAGITLAHELNGTALSVLVLEAGGLSQDVAAEEDSFTIDHLGIPYGNAVPTRGRWYGGSTNLWFGRIALPDAIDFEQRPWVPFSGWPLGYEEIQPWLQKAATILDVPHFDKIRIDRWPSNPTIETFVQHGGAELEVFLWAEGMFMGPRHREVIRGSENVRLLLDSTAIELMPNDNSTLVETVAVAGRAGNRFTVKATTFVLAAGGLENPRLLLASRTRAPGGIGNAEDLVGRFYMDHPRGEGLARVDLRGLTREQLNRVSLLGEKSRSQYGKVQLRLTFPARMQRDEQLLNHSLHAHLVSDIHTSPGFLAAKRLVARVKGSRQPGSHLAGDLAAALRGTPAVLRFAVQKALGAMTPTELIVIDQMEQEPDPTSRITIDPRRTDAYGLPKVLLDWRVGASTYRSQRRMHGLFKDILEKVGIRTFRSEVLDRPNETPRIVEMKHPSGTTRMHASPKQGVVDGDGRVHDVQNLYVAGTSIFPTVGHANPTLLIVALAARLAEHLRRNAAR